MKFEDPLTLTSRPSHSILFAASQHQGMRPRQDDYFVNFNDECFVVADGVSGMPHAKIAAELASQTAIWGYKHIRLRPFYWADKKLFLKRIFRSVNIAVWQKHREKEFEDGLATTLVVLIVGPRNFWLGSVGDSSAFLYREGLIDKLTRDDVDEQGFLIKAIGVARFGLTPRVVSEQFLDGDVVLLATDGVVNFVSEDEMRAIFENIGNTSEHLTAGVVELLKTARANGSMDNMTACLIKKVAVDRKTS